MSDKMESAKSSISEKVSIQTEQLSKLVCPVCFEYMKPPIMQCEKGHGICELCHELLSECPLCQSALTHRRSSHLETLTSLVLFPCKQCRKKFTLDELDVHKCCEDVEEPFSHCIIGQVYGECNWRGLAKDMVEHCSQQHPNNYWKKTENITKWKYCHLSSVGIQNIFVLDLTESLFVIVQKYDSNIESLQWNVSCECEKVSDQFVYEIQIFSDDKQDSLKYRNVIENQDNVMTSLPSTNEITIPINKVTDFINDNSDVYYKVIIHKKADLQNDSTVKYYQSLSEVRINVDSNRGTQNNDDNIKKTCTQKTWGSVMYVYNAIKNRLSC